MGVVEPVQVPPVHAFAESARAGESVQCARSLSFVRQWVTMILTERYMPDVRWCHSSVFRLWCEAFSEISWRRDPNRYRYHDHSSAPPNLNHFRASFRSRPLNSYKSDSRPVRNGSATTYRRESGITSITRRWWGRVTYPPVLGT